MTTAAKTAVWIVRILLAAFFAFVGYWKALGPIEALVEHHAWVAGFPAYVARAVGWQELTSAACLLVPVFSTVRHVAPIAAIILFLNQIAALVVHLLRGEAAIAAPQNILLLVLLLITAVTTSKFGAKST